MFNIALILGAPWMPYALADKSLSVWVVLSAFNNVTRDTCYLKLHRETKLYICFLSFNSVQFTLHVSM